MNDAAGEDRIVRSIDPDVPAGLRAVWPADVSALYVRGVFPTACPAIAIVGPVDPVPQARSWAFSCAREAARHGWAVVSGLARGIDGAAHEGALAGGGVTIGVVANGLDSVFPAGREALAARILDCGGTIVSIAPPGFAVNRERLLLRNQITSGLADIVLAVQSRGRGGTLATMRHACRQGKMIATFEPPAHGDSADWSGNAMLRSTDSPWRDRTFRWQPAFTLRDPADLAELFAQFSLRSPVDASPAFNETRKPEQPRLLEERATYAGDE